MIKFKMTRDGYHEILDDKGENIGFATFGSPYNGMGEFSVFDERDMETEFNAGRDQREQELNAGN